MAQAGGAAHPRTSLEEHQHVALSHVVEQQPQILKVVGVEEDLRATAQHLLELVLDEARVHRGRDLVVREKGCEALSRAVPLPERRPRCIGLGA